VRNDFFLVLILIVILTIFHNDRPNVSVAIMCGERHLEADWTSTRFLGVVSIVFALHVINISVVDEVFLILIKFSVLFVIVYLSPALWWSITVHYKIVPVKQWPQTLRWIRAKLEAFV
jgi:hypothetical protein